MPYKYPADQKTAALVQLERNRGDVHATAAQTGISVRTLQDWSRSIQAWLFPRAAPPAQNPAEVAAFTDDLSALAFIRTQIMNEMLRLSSSLQHDSGFSTPYQRVLVLSQLMDKLMKLDLHLQPYTQYEEQFDILDGAEDEEPDEEEIDDDEC